MESSRYTIGKLAQMTGLKTVTIRYYEKQGLVPLPARSGNGYRLYGDFDRERLLFIRRTRRLGFSLDDVRGLLRLADSSNAPCEDVDALVVQQLLKVRERITQLQALESELEQLDECCGGGGIIDNCQILQALSGERLSP